MISRTWISRRPHGARVAASVVAALLVGVTLPALSHAGDATKPAIDTDMVQRAVDAATAEGPGPKPEQAQDAERTVVVAEPPPADAVWLPHWVEAPRQNYTGDTLEELADMYCSRPSWILSANPGLTRNNLHSFKKVEVPVDIRALGMNNLLAPAAPPVVRAPQAASGQPVAVPGPGEIPHVEWDFNIRPGPNGEPAVEKISGSTRTLVPLTDLGFDPQVLAAAKGAVAPEPTTITPGTDSGAASASPQAPAPAAAGGTNGSGTAGAAAQNGTDGGFIYFTF